jgi:SAM-dependent methyltransferase
LAKQGNTADKSSQPLFATQHFCLHPNKPHLEQARHYWKNLLTPTDVVIDATCGNGKDTAYLSQLVPEGKVYSLDIQEEALIQAKKNVASSNVVFLLQSHASLPSFEPVKLVVYNLGYLPGGNKKITTMTESTLQSLEAASGIVKRGGALSITCYPGHLEGAREEKAVIAWIYQLNSLKWDVTHHQWCAGSPTLFFIIKK